VGSKAATARLLKKHDTIGVDLVANAVNRIVARGAEPLFVSACLESAHLDPQSSFPIIRGIADGCSEAECAFIEAETPERPDAYKQSDYHLVGFALGVAERSRLVAERRTEPGDMLVALPSSGLHTNGHLLARRIFFDQLNMSAATQIDALDGPLGEELMRPSRIYVRPPKRLLAAYRVKKVIRGISSVGDRGLAGAVERLLPDNCAAVVDVKRLPQLPIFDALRVLGELNPREMFDIFNMGVGMVMLVSSFYAKGVIKKLKRLRQPACIIGQVARGAKGVQFEF